MHASTFPSVVPLEKPDFALSAARALKRKSNLSAKEIASESLKVAARSLRGA